MVYYQFQVILSTVVIKLWSWSIPFHPAFLYIFGSPRRGEKNQLNPVTIGIGQQKEGQQVEDHSSCHPKIRDFLGLGSPEHRVKNWLWVNSWYTRVIVGVAGWLFHQSYGEFIGFDMVPSASRPDLKTHHTSSPFWRPVVRFRSTWIEHCILDVQSYLKVFHLSFGLSWVQELLELFLLMVLSTCWTFVSWGPAVSLDGSAVSNSAVAGPPLTAAPGHPLGIQLETWEQCAGAGGEDLTLSNRLTNKQLKNGDTHQNHHQDINHGSVGDFLDETADLKRTIASVSRNRWNHRQVEIKLEWQETTWPTLGTQDQERILTSLSNWERYNLLLSLHMRHARHFSHPKQKREKVGPRVLLQRNGLPGV